MQRFILFLDLQENPKLIREYENYHVSIPDEISKSIYDSGIISMEIFRFENRMCMEIVANDSFSFSNKNALDASNPAVQDWEQLMSKYQQIIPGTPDGAKWVLSNSIFSLTS
jgi:L-rhamnose mutarotase